MELDSAVMFVAAGAWTEMRLAVAALRRDVRHLKGTKLDKPLPLAALPLILLPWLFVAGVLAMGGCAPRVAHAVASQAHHVAAAANAVAPLEHGTPGGILATIALIGTGLAGVGFLACCVAAFFLPGSWVKRAAACLGLAAASQGLYWFALHVVALFWCGFAVAALCGLLWALMHRREIVEAAECATGEDFNHDGTIGRISDR